jgi:signal transduction histidine kinase
MIKRTHSISTKLFVLISLFLVLFLTLLMVVQSSSFEPYYLSKKEKQFKKGLEIFKSVHLAPDVEPSRAIQQLMNHANAFEKPFSATIAIGSIRDGALIASPEPRKTLIQIDKNGNFLNRLPLPLPDTQDSTMNYLIDAFRYWRSDTSLQRLVLDQGETVTFTNHYTDSVKTLAAVTSLPGNDYVLLAVASLQPVGEAAGIVRDFYVYFLLLAVVLILLLTYVFSRMITRPLVRLNQAAERMSKLDFTARCDVDSQDEIGSLGRTLNFLSQNLNETLGELSAANEKLKADIENEKRLERLRREFVASVSHELKTPISLIGGYAEGLKDGIVQGERRDEYLDVIIEETERMGNLVKDMLDLSQLESGKFHLQIKPFRIGALAESLTDKMFTGLNKKRIGCEVELEDPGATVLGDEFRIGQVLTNLLSNAIKHTPEGGNIRISTAEGPGSGLPGASGTLWVEVFNEGEPIPEADLEHIWDAFHTVDKSRNRELGGFGIGLAIVKNILTLHGSAFGVRNDAGGVTFFFTLPLAEEA